MRKHIYILSTNEDKALSKAKELTLEDVYEYNYDLSTHYYKTDEYFYILPKSIDINDLSECLTIYLDMSISLNTEDMNTILNSCDNLIYF